MNTIYQPSDSRGYANHGWLEARHTFSFAGYYDPARVHFGLLRVLNDDIIQAGEGFGTHPHDNMEIATIPIRGALEHRDSMGNGGVIHRGEIQVMSAGSGITHSEFNASQEEETNLLQIWVLPGEKNIEPRYDQMKYDSNLGRNELKTLISPVKSQDTLWLNQDTWFSLGDLDRGFELDYILHNPSHGVYFFVIEGKIQVEDQVLNLRDGLGVWNTEKLKLKVLDNSRVLAIEVPMR